jgi:hypothetical protein
MDINAPAPVQSTPDGTEYDAPAAKSDRVCSGIDITPTKNGGFTARCNYKPREDRGPKDRGPSYIEPDTYAFSTFDELVAYLRSELGGSASAPASEAAPAPAAAAPMADDDDDM